MDVLCSRSYLLLRCFWSCHTRIRCLIAQCHNSAKHSWSTELLMSQGDLLYLYLLLSYCVFSALRLQPIREQEELVECRQVNVLDCTQPGHIRKNWKKIQYLRYTRVYILTISCEQRYFKTCKQGNKAISDHSNRVIVILDPVNRKQSYFNHCKQCSGVISNSVNRKQSYFRHCKWGNRVASDSDSNQYLLRE